MNQNRTVFDIDEETDAFYLQKAVEYHEWLIQKAIDEETRTLIFRDREDAERRLRADYFDDHLWIDRCQTQRRKAKELRDKDTHISLQQNLMNHIWRKVEEASEED
ncbi:hypothetical protein Tco_1076371 [Tanacetum coccineum]